MSVMCLLKLWRFTPTKCLQYRKNASIEFGVEYPFKKRLL